MFNLFQIYPKIWSKCIPMLFQIYVQLIPNVCQMYSKFRFKCMPNLFPTYSKLMPHVCQIYVQLMPHLFQLDSNLFHNVDLRFLFAAVFFLQESCDYGSRLGWATAQGIVLMHQSCQSQAMSATLHQNHVCGVAVAVAVFGSAGARQCMSSSGGSGSSGAARLISSRSGCFCVFWRNTRFLGCTMSSDKISWGFPAGLNHSEL